MSEPHSKPFVLAGPGYGNLLTLGGGCPSAYWRWRWRFPFKKELRPANSRRRPREWSGVEWSGVEWSGGAVEWSDWTVEWSGGAVAGRGGYI